MTQHQSSRPIYSGEGIERALTDPNNTHAILLRLAGRGQDVLEIGCATGYLTRILVESAGCQVDGVELDPEAAEKALPFLRDLIVGDLDDAQTLGRLRGDYDVILIGDVLEHLIQPERLLDALSQHLRPSGRLIVSVPNVAHWSVRRSLLFGRWETTETGLMDRTHLRWYTQRTARALLEGTGFHIRDHFASYAFPAHGRSGLLQRLGVWAQGRRMPAFFDNLFALQHIFVATKS